MDAGPGIEPGSGAYETPELPLLYPATTIYTSYSACNKELSKIFGVPGWIQTSGFRDLQSLALGHSATETYSLYVNTLITHRVNCDQLIDLAGIKMCLHIKWRTENTS